MEDYRKSLLSRLIKIEGNIFKLNDKLNQLDWDVFTPLLVIKKKHIKDILERTLNNSIDFKTLEEWANMVESRDDLDFENNEVQEIIIELANPVLYGKLSNIRLLELLEKINRPGGAVFFSLSWNGE